MSTSERTRRRTFVEVGVAVVAVVILVGVLVMPRLATTTPTTQLSAGHDTEAAAADQSAQPVEPGATGVQRVEHPRDAAHQALIEQLGVTCFEGSDSFVVVPADYGRQLDEKIRAAGGADAGWIGKLWYGDEASLARAYPESQIFSSGTEAWVVTIQDRVGEAMHLEPFETDDGHIVWESYDSVVPCGQDRGEVE